MLGLSVSVGAIRRCVDRVSQAIVPYDEKIAHRARSAKVNHVDETACSQHGVLGWLWVMVNPTVAFFSVKASRSNEAFREWVGHWAGILVSDGLKLTAHGRRPDKPAWLIESAGPRGWLKERMPLWRISGSGWSQSLLT